MRLIIFLLLARSFAQQPKSQEALPLNAPKVAPGLSTLLGPATTPTSAPAATDAPTPNKLEVPKNLVSPVEKPKSPDLNSIEKKTTPSLLPTDAAPPPLMPKAIGVSFEIGVLKNWIPKAKAGVFRPDYSGKLRILKILNDVHGLSFNYSPLRSDAVINDQPFSTLMEIYGIGYEYLHPWEGLVLHVGADLNYIYVYSDGYNEVPEPTIAQRATWAIQPFLQIGRRFDNDLESGFYSSFGVGPTQLFNFGLFVRFAL